jgi:hypothetical protein
MVERHPENGAESHEGVARCANGGPVCEEAVNVVGAELGETLAAERRHEVNTYRPFVLSESVRRLPGALLLLEPPLEVLGHGDASIAGR